MRRDPPTPSTLRPRLGMPIVTSLELTPIPKMGTPKGDDNLRDAPSKKKGAPKIGIVMRRCPA
eukprot:2813469-Pyramimonas_sp.AAC.1